MTIFLRLLSSTEKADELSLTVNSVRSGVTDDRVFDRNPAIFRKVPSSPFSYWESEDFLDAFERLEPFESNGRRIFKGAATSDNFRFVRTSWECHERTEKWYPYAKGGAYSPVYSDIPLLVNWAHNAVEMEAEVLKKYPYLNGDADWVLHRESYYFHPGITWPARTTSLLGMRAMPSGAVFGHKGPAGFLESHNDDDLLCLLGLCISAPFIRLVGLQLAAADAAARSYEIGTIQRTPLPVVPKKEMIQMAGLVRKYWNKKRNLDTVVETSHAFHLPSLLRGRLGAFNPSDIEKDLTNLQSEIDEIAYNLYGLSKDVSISTLNSLNFESDEFETDDDSEEEEQNIDEHFALLSWAVGIAFGRFDMRIATGERLVPDAPNPFDPLPNKSPAMLPDGFTPFHIQNGILVDDKGHPHDLSNLIEEVLAKVNIPSPTDIRRWLQKDFFAFHLQCYSKSRRKAPIYWPLSTKSGAYTLWIYYPSLTNQTLYNAINDFIEPKLKEVTRDLTTLRSKGTKRTQEDENHLESLQGFESELTEMLEIMLKIAPTYKPNFDDGVQISASPLWMLFRHKPWQKTLKETWEKLERGDFDWSYLAMNYWPKRVREKCKTNKSFSIAHGLMDSYAEPEIVLKTKTTTKKKKTE